MGRSVEIYGVGCTCRFMENKWTVGFTHLLCLFPLTHLKSHAPKVCLRENPNLYLFSQQTEFSLLTLSFLCKRPSSTSPSCAVALRAPARSEPTRRLAPPRMSHAGPALVAAWAGLKALVVSHKRAGSPDQIAPLLFMICE